jgi:hypothetical protein
LYELLIGISPFRVENINMNNKTYEEKVLQKEVAFPDKKKYKI